jgi:hypothetical protein
VPHDWPCQNTKRIREDDRFFLLRNGRKPIGIMGSGLILSPSSYPARRDSSRGRVATWRVCYNRHDEMRPTELIEKVHGEGPSFNVRG